MSGSLASARASGPASLPHAGQIWRYVYNVNPLSTSSEPSQVDQGLYGTSGSMSRADSEVEAYFHSATQADSIQLAISAALADSYKLASSAHLASSGLVPASPHVGSPSVRRQTTPAGDKEESATLATIVWPGAPPPEVQSVAPLPTVSSLSDGCSSSPRSPASHHPSRNSMQPKPHFSRQVSSAVPEIVSDDPVEFIRPSSSTVDLYPVPPRTPPNNSIDDNPLYLPDLGSPTASRPSTSPFIPNLPARDALQSLQHRERSPTPQSTFSPSPSPRPTQPHDLSPASARGGWVRRDVRRRSVRLGADRLPSASPSRHTVAAAGPASRSAGSSMLHASRSALELRSQTSFDAASVDGSEHGAAVALRTGRGVHRRADSDAGSHRSRTPPGSVAGSSFAASPRLPWAPQTERRARRSSSALRLGATSRSPAAFARHPPAAAPLASSSFLDEYEDAETLVRLRRSSTATGRTLRPCASATDLRGGSSVAAGASFFSAGRIGAPSEAASDLSRRPSLAARLGGGRDRGRYLQTLYTNSIRSTDRPPAAPAATPPGVPSLNFRTYDFGLSRKFTFSDGSRIKVHGDCQG